MGTFDMMNSADFAIINEILGGPTDPTHLSQSVSQSVEPRAGNSYKPHGPSRGPPITTLTHSVSTDSSFSTFSSFSTQPLQPYSDPPMPVIARSRSSPDY